MERVSATEQSVIPILLMMLLLAAVILVIFAACLTGYWVKRKKETDPVDGAQFRRDAFERPAPFLFDRPSRWLAMLGDGKHGRTKVYSHDLSPCFGQ